MTTAANTRFKVSQVAGLLRMEGIVVSPRNEQLLAAIIDGKANAAEERRRLVKQFKKQNAVRSV